ncbi:sensor histidine kinase [Microlunatus kandeliicorticis]|uniref:sensor histidine kinase n=1 Tax=Microlunatus kandeliicorticis TaxID=1759536 RepID=UPI001C7288FE|nr:histidine kinase [Microlunatus kandeliicorticis]
MRRRWSLLRLEPFGEFEDPHAAPLANRCDDEGGPAPAWTLRRAVQNRLAMFVFGLVFMVFPAITFAQLVHTPGRIAVAVAQMAALVVLYAGTSLVADLSLRARCAYLGAFAAVMASTAFLIGFYFSGFGVYFAIMIASLVPWRVARGLVVVWGVWLALLGLITAQWTPVFIALIAVGIGWAVGTGMEQGRVAAKLRQVELRATELAVVSERERIARDLHDILGHSLTAVSIKAGLAGRLVGIDDAGARAQIADVEAIARQALADVRSTASAMRQVRLATEIASARSVLLAAGITAEAPSALDPLPESVSELLGYAVREAVTNVVRHSGATRCVITAGPGTVCLADDGIGLGRVRMRGRSDGSGLRGLGQRLEAGGGELVLEAGLPRDGGHGLAVRAVVPLQPVPEPGGAPSAVAVPMPEPADRAAEPARGER